ncbi:hypothetical protein BGX26_006160 [Mortierella sp. AD094]|nr:hypothetical protein BGX26_006160 [Mortierella sp. AD094]
MPEPELPHVIETTPLLSDNTSAYKKPSERALRPNYWFAVAALVVAGIRVGSTSILTIPFLQELFCDRGIPEGLYPIHNGTDAVTASNVFWGQLIGDMPNNDDGHCDSAEFNATLARFFSISHVLVAITVTMTICYWSGLSVCIGCKRTIQLCNFGALVAQLLYVVVRKNRDVSLYYIWVADLIEGLAGSPYITIASAYAVDVTSPDERTVVLGRLSAGDMIGFTLGVAIGGLVARSFGLEFVFVWLAPAFDLLNILYIFWMPESLTEAELHNNRIQRSKATLVQFQKPHDFHPKSLKQTWTNVLETCETRLKAFIKGFAPEQLPNRLPGKNGFVFIILIVFIIDLSNMCKDPLL